MSRNPLRFIGVLWGKFLDGRAFVTPDDVSFLAGPVLTHRLILNQKSRHAGLAAAELVAALVKKTRVPV